MKTDFVALCNDNFENLESVFPIKEIRKRAIDDLKNKSFPNEKMENWRNFSLKSIQENAFSLNPESENQSLNFFSQMDFSDAFETIIFNNGNCTYTGQIEKFKNGIIFGSLRAAIITNKDLVLKYLNKLNKNENSLAALNSALISDGFFLYIPSDINLDLPFNITDILNSEQNNITTQRNLVIIEKNSNVAINHNSASVAEDNQLSVNITEIYVDENSSIEWNTMQKHNGNSTIINLDFIDLKADSKLIRNIIALGSNNTRNEVNAKLDGQNANADINGAYLLAGHEKLENRVFIDHAYPECDSNQLFKGILDDYSKGAFTGKILVRKDSQKTNAFQSTKNILLHENAKMAMNPFLEIYADDVKCSHGASVGEIDEDALFYLQARGISKQEAKTILLRSFVLEILEKISNESYRNYVSEKIVERLK
jgi:Fe-S cluster assembly protein SufD